MRAGSAHLLRTRGNLAFVDDPLADEVRTVIIAAWACGAEGGD
jgi:hypothetical protein